MLTKDLLASFSGSTWLEQQQAIVYMSILQNKKINLGKYLWSKKDKTMDDKLIYIPNYNKQKLPLL